MQITAYRNHTLLLAWIFAIVMLFVAAFNILIDPFWLFDSPKIEGINVAKPQFATNVRMAKAHSIRRLRPQSIILGSSRAEYGLDPAHSGWPADAQPVYNLALSSGRIYEALRYLQHSHNTHALKQVVLGVDLFMFDTHIPSENGFTESRLSLTQTPNLGWIRDYIIATVSMDAIRASVKTLEKQEDPGQIFYLPNGFRDPARSWERVVAVGGHRQATDKTDKNSLYAKDGWQYFRLFDDQGRSESMKSFRQIVQFCVNNNIALKVIISPAHARKWTIIDQTGLWETWEHWKYEMVTIVEQENNSLTTAGAAAEIWDFSGYNSITTEPIPADNDTTTQMQWYWESSHYKKEVGDLMLDRLFAYHQPDRPAVPAFGVKMTADNWQAHQQNVRAQKEDYSRQFKNEVNEIRTLANGPKSQR